jgi:hypothetical protein
MPLIVRLLAPSAVTDDGPFAAQGDTLAAAVAAETESPRIGVGFVLG